MLLLATDWTAISAIATAAAALVSAGVVAVALLQRRDARDSAIAATRAAAAAEEGVRIQGDMYAEQSRLSIYPPLTVEFRAIDPGVEVQIANPGTVPGLDVDLYVIGVMFTWAADHEEFITQYVRPEDHEDVAAKGLNADGAYGMYDRFIYSSFPPNSTVAASTRFPFTPNQIVGLFQYRDMLGRNYRHVFFASVESDRYSMSFDHERVEDRIRVDPLADMNLPADSNDHLDELFDLFAHSAAPGVLLHPTQTWTGVEDRGVWANLR